MDQSGCVGILRLAATTQNLGMWTGDLSLRMGSMDPGASMDPRACPSFRREAGRLAQEQGHSVGLPLTRLPRWLLIQWTSLLDLSVLWGVGEEISIASWLSTWSGPRALFITVGLGQVNLLSHGSLFVNVGNSSYL